MINNEPIYVDKFLLNILKVSLIIIFLRFFVLNVILVFILIVVYQIIRPVLDPVKAGPFFIYVLYFTLMSLTGIIVPVYGCLILNAVLVLGLYLIRYLDSVNN